MQFKAAKFVGFKLGGELAIAAKEGAKIGSILVLGDRKYSVTIQRIFDKLSIFDKVKMLLVLIWEVLTMSLFKLKEYISKTENDQNFVDDEIKRFAKYLPSFAEVLITERDEYLSQSIIQTVKIGFTQNYKSFYPTGNVLAVIGAGHLPGIQRNLKVGGVPLTRLYEISKSTKHVEPTWPSDGSVQIVDTKQVFPDQQINK